MRFSPLYGDNAYSKKKANLCDQSVCTCAFFAYTAPEYYALVSSFLLLLQMFVEVSNKWKVLCDLSGMAVIWLKRRGCYIPYNVLTLERARTHVCVLCVFWCLIHLRPYFGVWPCENKQEIPQSHITLHLMVSTLTYQRLQFPLLFQIRKTWS